MVYFSKKGGDFMKKVLIFALAILLLAAGGLVLHLFVIGDPVDGSLVICDVTENGGQLNIHVTTPASAIAFTDNVQLRQSGTTLHITLRKVLVSPLYSSGSRMIWIEKNDLTEVYLGGIQIWTAS